MHCNGMLYEPKGSFFTFDGKCYGSMRVGLGRVLSIDDWFRVSRLHIKFHLATVIITGIETSSLSVQSSVRHETDSTSLYDIHALICVFSRSLHIANFGSVSHSFFVSSKRQVQNAALLILLTSARPDLS